MKRLSTIGISILIVGGIFLILMGIDYAQLLKSEEYLKIHCRNPATNCPVLDYQVLSSYAIIDLILVSIGSTILVSSKIRSKL